MGETSLKPPNFKNDHEKWLWLEDAPLHDMKAVAIQIIARHLWEASLKRPTLFAHLAAAMARDGIKYQIDTERVGHEDLGHPLEALFRGVDDCDSKSRLFVALCLSAGVPAKMQPLWRGTFLQHVFAAVQLNRKWYPVELTLSRARIGDLPENVPKEKTGTWAKT